MPAGKKASFEEQKHRRVGIALSRDICYVVRNNGSGRWRRQKEGVGPSRRPTRRRMGREHDFVIDMRPRPCSLLDKEPSINDVRTEGELLSPKNSWVSGGGGRPGELCDCVSGESQNFADVIYARS